MSSVADSVERIRGFQRMLEEGRSPLWESVGIAVAINLAGNWLAIARKATASILY
ncbi:hypothetical protein QUA54_32515 [Microcoleus sp. MOSTC5]|uniref:hypothetical protein n=1 Tax=unclassified Microcoleus TaxID=2642155 RepID=UPI002FD726F2